MSKKTNILDSFWHFNLFQKTIIISSVIMGLVTAAYLEALLYISGLWYNTSYPLGKLETLPIMIFLPSLIWYFFIASKINSKNRMIIFIITLIVLMIIIKLFIRVELPCFNFNQSNSGSFATKLVFSVSCREDIKMIIPNINTLYYLFLQK